MNSLYFVRLKSQCVQGMCMTEFRFRCKTTMHTFVFTPDIYDIHFLKHKYTDQYTVKI